MSNIRSRRIIRMILAAMLFLPLLELSAAGKVEVSVIPQPVRTGEEAYLILRSTDGSRNLPLSNRLPKVDGLDWQHGIRQSSQTRIINGRRSDIFEAYIPFTVSKPGRYTIPSMNLTHSHERTKKVTFEAVESRYQTAGRNASGRTVRDSSEEETELSAKQIMFMETEIPARKPFYYLGEEIPLEINIFVLEGMQAQLSWPQIEFSGKGSAVFRDYKQSNPENPNFAPVMPRKIRRDGRYYTVYRFQTALRPISAGKLEFSVRENAALVVRDRRRSRSSDPFFDDFFGDSFFSRGRQVAHNMRSGISMVEIRNLPPVPEGVRYTGLTGNWESQVTLSPPPYKVGEPITMKVEFSGTGSTDTLRSWPLDLKGFRVYPPEVEKRSDGAEIRYVLIPTEPSEGKSENVSFGPYAVFSSGKYQTGQFKQAIVVEKGSAVIPGNTGTYAVDAPAADQKAVQDTAKRKAEDILYLKKTEGKRVPLPPEVNIFGGILLILAGALFFVVAVIVKLVRRTRENDPDYQRKVSARSRKSELLKRIRQMSPEDFPAGCSGDIASYIADARGLAPGADLSECAAAVKTQSPELAGMLDELSQAAWMPSMKSRFTPEFRNALVKALAKIAVIALACIPGMLNAASPAASSADQAMSAYDKGDFPAAEKYYRSRFNPAEPSANLLYNIGNCLFQQGYFPQAMVCFERAERLSPRDPDILENLNLTRRKLMLPEKYQVNKPSDIPPWLRDSLRPDEWLFLICAGIALLFAAGGIAVLIGPGRTFRILLVIGILLILLPGAAYLFQRQTSYNPDFAVVTAKNPSVYSLPSDQAGKVEMKLRSGEEVVIVERRMEWIRIRSGNAEGWIHAKDITCLWNPDSAGGI